MFVIRKNLIVYRIRSNSELWELPGETRGWLDKSSLCISRYSSIIRNTHVKQRWFHRYIQYCIYLWVVQDQESVGIRLIKPFRAITNRYIIHDKK